MSPTDATQSRHWHDPDAVAATRRHLEVHGCPEEVLDSVFDAWQDAGRERAPGGADAADRRRRRAGRRRRGVAGDPGPGHADGQFALLGTRSRAAARRRRDPRPDRAVRRRPSRLAARPARRPPRAAGAPRPPRRRDRVPGPLRAITDVAGRANEIREHHAERLRRTARCWPTGLPTPTQASLRIYGDRLGPNSRRIAVVGVARAPRAPRTAGRDRAARRRGRARSVRREMTHDHDHSDGHEHGHDHGTSTATTPATPAWEVKELSEEEVDSLLEEGKLVQVEGPDGQPLYIEIGGVRRGCPARPRGERRQRAVPGRRRRPAAGRRALRPRPRRRRAGARGRPGQRRRAAAGRHRRGAAGPARRRRSSGSTRTSSRRRPRPRPDAPRPRAARARPRRRGRMPAARRALSLDPNDVGAIQALVAGDDGTAAALERTRRWRPS